MAFTLGGRLDGKRVTVLWDDGEIDAGRNTELILELVASLDEVETPVGDVVPPNLDDEEIALFTLEELLDDPELLESDTVG